MTTQEKYLLPDNSTDVNFRAWGKALSDFLTACGVTKTADTGQIDWTTVTRPLATSTSQGYEIRQLTDSAQSTFPQYIKIEYGSASGAATIPQVWVTTGTATNGSGTLTGFGLGRQVIVLAASASSTQPYPCWFSGRSSGFAISMFVGLASTRAVLSFERSLNSSGSGDGNGTLVAQLTSLATSLTAYANPQGAASSGGVGFSGGLLPRLCTTSSANVNLGQQLPFAAICSWMPGKGVAYTQNLLTVGPMVEGTVFTATRYGVTRTYRVVGGSGGWSARSGDSAAAGAMVWE